MVCACISYVRSVNRIWRFFFIRWLYAASKAACCTQSTQWSWLPVFFFHSRSLSYRIQCINENNNTEKKAKATKKITAEMSSTSTIAWVGFLHSKYFWWRREWWWWCCRVCVCVYTTFNCSFSRFGFEFVIRNSYIAPFGRHTLVYTTHRVHFIQNAPHTHTQRHRQIECAGVKFTRNTE